MEVVIAEVLPVIKSCTIFGKTSKNFEKLAKIVVKESNCCFEFEDNSKVTIQFPFGTTLVPDSASGYNYDGSSIILRAQVGEKTTLVHSVLSELINEIEDFNPFISDYIHFKPDKTIAVSCRYCSTQITNFTAFRRTCQLPSVNWEQASEDWFCCLEKPVKDSIKPHSLQPSEDECFYAELFYVLNKRNLCNKEIITGDKIMCCECNFQIGNVYQDSIRFWKHSIKWINESHEVLYYQTESESIVSLFDNIDKDSFGVNCRLVLEKQTNPKQFIFMVTMDVNLKFLMSPNVFFGNKFNSNYNQDGTEKNKVCEGNSIPIKKLCLNVKDDLSNIETSKNCNIELNKYSVIKLLFNHKIGEDGESALWIDDINVHILPCGDKFFDTVLKDLNNSNNLLPSQSNSANDMSIGYIMR